MLGSAPAGFVASSYLFVDFFFILSGFVMTHVYREQITHGMPFKKYALLRVARLYPLHVFAHLLYAFSVLCKWLAHHAGVEAREASLVVAADGVGHADGVALGVDEQRLLARQRALHGPTEEPGRQRDGDPRGPLRHARRRDAHARPREVGRPPSRAIRLRTQARSGTA